MTTNVIGLPARSTLIETGAPWAAWMTSLIGRSALTGCPFASTSTSPARSPAVAAGRPGTGSMIFCVFDGIPKPSSTTSMSTNAVR